MNPREYAAMFAVEDRHWWFRGVRAEIRRSLERAGAQPDRWLDAGCGTGGLLAGLSMRGGVGVDVSFLGLVPARSRGLRRLAQASVTALPFPAAAFDCVTSVDVLAHRLVDTGAALRETHRVLAPGGLLILQLPAFEALRGGHDDAVWTRRRYRKGEVERMVLSSGFQVRSIFYRNSLLFPIAGLRRLLARGGGPEGARSDVGAVAGPVNAALFTILEVDAALRRWGLRLPFGLSVFCVARKAGAAGAALG